MGWTFMRRPTLSTRLRGEVGHLCIVEDHGDGLYVLDSEQSLWVGRGAAPGSRGRLKLQTQNQAREILDLGYLLPI